MFCKNLIEHCSIKRVIVALPSLTVIAYAYQKPTRRAVVTVREYLGAGLGASRPRLERGLRVFGDRTDALTVSEISGCARRWPCLTFSRACCGPSGWSHRSSSVGSLWFYTQYVPLAGTYQNKKSRIGAMLYVCSVSTVLYIPEVYTVVFAILNHRWHAKKSSAKVHARDCRSRNPIGWNATERWETEIGKPSEAQLVLISECSCCSRA